jgi:hypothetical protein
VCTRESIWNPNCNTLEPDRTQHDYPSACVIAQRCSASTFFSFHFNFRNKKKKKLPLIGKMLKFELLYFEGAFGKLPNATISFVMSVCPSVCMGQIGSHWTDFHEM